MIFFVTLFALGLTVQTAFAADASLTRRDGFLQLWNEINRPAYETRSEYSDVPEGSIGHLEISYGKRRGILLDGDEFFPDEQLAVRDALLWLFRTRNVRELPDMDIEDLPGMLADYPIVGMNEPLTGTITSPELRELSKSLDEMLRKEVHEVSYYADAFHGAGTAFGETFDMYAITAAHRSYPHNTLVKVTNVDNGESVVVRINDRGPYVHGRSMDLSKAAFESIEHTGRGILNATFERLGDVELIQGCPERETVYQQRITRDVRFFRGVPHNFDEGEQLILQSTKPFVVLGITFPDGDYLRIQDFVLPDEKYRFTPSEDGLHIFHVGDTLGRERNLRMNVAACGL